MIHTLQLIRSIVLGLTLAAFGLAACSPNSAPGGEPAEGTPGLETQAPTDPANLPESTPTQAPAPTDAPASPTTALAPEPVPTEIEAPTPAPPTLAPPTAAPGVFPHVSNLPDPAQYEWRPVTGPLRHAIGLAHAGDGSGRLFFVGKKGQLFIIRDGQWETDPFLDIMDRVGSDASERGLLGLAFHPRYAENGYFYVNYTDLNGNTVIARFNVTEDPDRADPSSEKQVLYAVQPYSNHNGGGLAFGPDGYLYIALGDGGSGGDPQGNGQSLQSHLGKLLRIDVDGGDPYAIPPDNPFAAGGGLPEIWAYGLRNPWRFSFDRLTGDLYIADVGQNEWEEIDFLPAGGPGGANFGWNFREAGHGFMGTPPEGLDLIDPVAEYDHSLGCSVTGGYVYRGASLPEWQGVYIYGDYCTGNVWGLLRGPGGAWQNELLYQGTGTLASFGEDEAGEIYLVDRNGSLLRLSER
jgi:glucose/arabinose dehydrogenase